MKSEDEESDVDDERPKKKRKPKKEVDDAKLAAMLQAEENGRVRSTRGGGKGASKKKGTVKRKVVRKKSEKKVRADDDSDVEDGSDGKEKARKGGFHKQYHLSAPLADLVGEYTVSLSHHNEYSERGCSKGNSSRDHRLSRRSGSTSRSATFKIRTTSARSAAMIRCSWSSSRRKCTCSP